MTQASIDIILFMIQIWIQILEGDQFSNMEVTQKIIT